MSGYNPAFDTVFTGTLHGKWPDMGLWMCLVAMADKQGRIDCTPQYIASVTGLDVTQVISCIKRFMDPDEHSRSPAEEGRRLVPIDPNRAWGWVMVNHSSYRERARLMAKSEREVADGSNRKRMDDRRRPPETAETKSRPPLTAADPLSESESESESEGSAEGRSQPAVADPTPPEKPKRKVTGKHSSQKRPIPDDFDLNDERKAYAEKHLPAVDAAALMAVFRSTSKAQGWKYVDWDQHWQTLVRHWAPNSGHWSAGQYPRKSTLGVQKMPDGTEVRW